MTGAAMGEHHHALSRCSCSVAPILWKRRHYFPKIAVAGGGQDLFAVNRSSSLNTFRRSDQRSVPMRLGLLVGTSGVSIVKMNNARNRCWPERLRWLM
jgi:hypothetical protein